MPNKVYKKPAYVLQRHVGNETVLLNTESEFYFGLNQLGSELFERLCAGENFDRVTESIGEAHDVDINVQRDNGLPITLPWFCHD